MSHQTREFLSARESGSSSSPMSSRSVPDASRTIRSTFSGRFLVVVDCMPRLYSGGRSRLPFVYPKMEGIIMRAVVVDHESKARQSVAEAEEPEPGPLEALVRVAAISLNRGEVRRAEAAEPGFRPGWDLAGTVGRPAADGSGPQEGSRVVGFLPSGAWAELVARRWGRSPGGS